MTSGIVLFVNGSNNHHDLVLRRITFATKFTHARMTRECRGPRAVRRTLRFTGNRSLRVLTLAHITRQKREGHIFEIHEQAIYSRGNFD